MKAFPSKQEASRKFLGVKGGVPQFEDGQDASQAGMDLRDYFAAKVLSGIYSIELGQPNFKTIAEDAYKQADAMMEAREAL